MFVTPEADRLRAAVRVCRADDKEVKILKARYHYGND